MSHPVSRARRALFAALLLLPSACMAAPRDHAAPPSGATERQGALFGAMLAGDYAEATGQERAAAQYDMEAATLDPGNRTLLRHAFATALLAGSPDALRLARLMPGNALAAMLRGNDAVMKQDYKDAEADYAAMPKGGVTGLIRPLLIAWAEDGTGETGRAIDRLKSLA
ncbi:MAG TPA: hypothetical protein VFN77_11315, partial [Acetobacteraceae bacterium]|nr:hypothetical protein [Acetobacteraceae bacterium]